MNDHVICPGCGWHGPVNETSDSACPECGYENGCHPYRLLTLVELTTDPLAKTWDGVDLAAFLRAVDEIRGV